jgi:hypothetical protein
MEVRGSENSRVHISRFEACHVEYNESREISSRSGGGAWCQEWQVSIREDIWETGKGLASVLCGIRFIVGASKLAPEIVAGFRGHGSVLKASLTLGIGMDDAFCDRASPEDLEIKHIH